MTRANFDANYYRRFYAQTPVHSRNKVAVLASAVHAMCAWWDVRVKSMLDVGAGIGYWRDWYRTNHPQVRLQSVDISEHACKKYGHDQHDITSWSPSRPFDLVVCHGVLQYVSDRDAVRAIDNLAAATKHVLYLEIPTKADLTEVVDTKSTDLDIHWRAGEWYRKRLGKHFVQAGAGLWVKRSSSIVLYELERCN